MRLLTFTVTALTAFWMPHAMADSQEKFLEVASGQFSNMYQLAAGSGAATAPAIRLDVTRVEGEESDWLEVVHRDIRSESVILRHQLFHLVESGSETHFSTAVYYVPVDSSKDATHSLYSESDLPIAQWVNQSGAYKLEGCEIQWTDQSDRFHGVRDSESCYFYGPDGERISLTSALELSEQGWSIQDTAIALESEYLPAAVTGDTIQFRRITFFEADIEFLPSGLDEPVDASLRKPLHDHGEQVQLYAGNMILPLKLSVVSEADGSLRLQVFNRNSQVAAESRKVEAKELGEPIQLGELTIRLETKSPADK